MVAEGAQEALQRLGEATAEAVRHVLYSTAAQPVELGEVAMLPDGTSPLDLVSFPAVALSARHAGEAGGAIVFLASPEAADLLAARRAQDADGEEGAEGAPAAGEDPVLLDVAQRIVSAAAGVTGLLLGEQVEIEPPHVVEVADAVAVEAILVPAPYITAISLEVGGHACTLIQLLPDGVADALAVQAGLGADTGGLAAALGDLRLRVWAEIGRTRVPLGRALELPPGAVVELDRAVDEPVEVFVNGLLFGRGSLVITDDGEWAIRLSSIEANPSRRGPLS